MPSSSGAPYFTLFHILRSACLSVLSIVAIAAVAELRTTLASLPRSFAHVSVSNHVSPGTRHTPEQVSKKRRPSFPHTVRVEICVSSLVPLSSASSENAFDLIKRKIRSITESQSPMSERTRSRIKSMCLPWPSWLMYFANLVMSSFSSPRRTSIAFFSSVRFKDWWPTRVGSCDPRAIMRYTSMLALSLQQTRSRALSLSVAW